MNNTQFRVTLRPDKSRKDGTKTLVLYASVNGKRKYYSLHKSVLEKYWNEEKQIVSSRCDNWDKINRTIKNYINKAEDLAIRANLDNRIIKLSDLDYLLRGEQFDHENIISFIDNYIKLFRNKYDPSTIAVYITLKRNIENFDKDISFNELSIFWWLRFEMYLIEKPNSKNTVFKQFKTLKTFINHAILQGVIKENPLKSAKVEKEPGKTIYLTLEEVNKLEELYKKDISKKYLTVLRYFLFSCYTGLRFGDIEELKFKHIFDGNYIEKVMRKGKRKLINIPLSNRAKALLPKMSLLEKPVFHVYSNQFTDRALKDIMILAKINKRISFHSSRHTNGTLTLMLSGNIVAVQKLLGHSKIETTLLYAKLLDSDKQAAVDKWNAV